MYGIQYKTTRCTKKSRSNDLLSRDKIIELDSEVAQMLKLSDEFFDITMVNM